MPVGQCRKPGFFELLCQQPRPTLVHSWLTKIKELAPFTLQQENTYYHQALANSNKPVPDANASVFFARCPPSITEGQLHEVFTQFGTVIQVNIFRRWAAAKSSKGCGIITFQEKQAAEAALVLDGQHKFADSEVPMVVERCDVDRQRAPSAGNVLITHMDQLLAHSIPSAIEWQSCLFLG